ncbi:hypothetical protein AGABI2DRAFT_191376 [Agaricus bisporus var. bisporus H97]|uniref:hypothetical protein n=1 Tax=Agaricus bisporus var. bisporus (strain H97 / ATCC MYA-4626 / FGSC 10389) TaxID=936046 RepID=UPI00029F7FD9|nr:hypothetical protein AGABI2DRAFT_191376 [Agaricus bisporus var. bisporus H97]EKV49312.1 hypothetical protein AGABI2DRAFT_191376 [Agaricus bisporus var. bisporus H97]
MPTSGSSSSAKPLRGRMTFVVSLPSTSQELSPLSESASLPPVPFQKVAASSGGQMGYTGINGAGGNAGGTTNQSNNALQNTNGN